MTKSKVSPEQEIKGRIGKKEISKSLREIETKGCGMVLNFSTNKKNNGYFVGKTDYEIICKHVIVMAELKIEKDKLSQRQIDYANYVIGLNRPGIVYVIFSEKNYLQVKNAILSQDVESLYAYEKLSEEILLSEQERLTNLILKRSKK